MELELRHITKTFGPLKANNDINYTFQGGTTYAILGENGAGKSTLMKIISGYQPPDEGGQILVDETPISIQSPSDAIQYGIGMLYQDPLDFPPMTVLENYVTDRGDEAFLPNWNQRRKELAALCERFGFQLDPDALIESLSIGERQQLEIVRLLSLGVQFLILDEPTTGISDEQRQRLFDTLRQLAVEDGMIVVIVTHKLEDVHALCDEVLVLRHGQVTGTPSMPVTSEQLVLFMFGHPPEQQQIPKVPLGDSVLQVDDLTVHTRFMSIEGINIDVREGEVIGLAGLDGSGQVQFMRACAGLDRTSWQEHLMSVIAFVIVAIIFERILGFSQTVLIVTLLVVFSVTIAPVLVALLRNTVDTGGEVKYRGKSIRWLGYRDLRQQGLAYLSAGRLEEGLVTGLTLTQHFALADIQRLPWINWFSSLGQTQQAIQTYDIRGQAVSPIQTLSGGNQQRVALGLLPPNLQLVFLENPSRGLDVNSAQNIWKLLLDRRESGTAIVFSSPDLDEILQYSDRVMVFSSGKYTVTSDTVDKRTVAMMIGGVGI